MLVENYSNEAMAYAKRAGMMMGQLMTLAAVAMSLGTCSKHGAGLRAYEPEADGMCCIDQKTKVNNSFGFDETKVPMRNMMRPWTYEQSCEELRNYQPWMTGMNHMESMTVGETSNGFKEFMATVDMMSCMDMAMVNMSWEQFENEPNTDFNVALVNMPDDESNTDGSHSKVQGSLWPKFEDDDADDMYYPDKPMMHGLEKYVMKTSAWQCLEKDDMVIKYDLTTSVWQCLVNTLDVLDYDMKQMVNYDFKIPGLQCLVKNVKKQFLQSLVNYDFKVYVVKELVENYVEYFVYTVLWMVMGISYNMTFVFKFFMVVAGNCTLLAMGVSWTMSPSRTFLTSGLQRLALAWFTLYQLTEGKVFELSVLTVAVICIMWHRMLSTRWIQRFALDIKHVSRCCKRKQSRQKRICKRQLVVMIFMCFAVNARAMEQQDAMFQRISALAEAATRAAVAAEQVVTQTAGAASSASGDGLQNAAKVLKNPEMFSGEDALAFPSWRFQFTSWLTYGESKYVPMLEKIEKLTSPPDVSTYTAEEKTLATDCMQF